MLVFWGEGKTRVPREKSLGAMTRTNNKLDPHVTPSPGIEPGPHWWEASALTTAPSLLPHRDSFFVGLEISTILWNSLGSLHLSIHVTYQQKKNNKDLKNTWKVWELSINGPQFSVDWIAQLIGSNCIEAWMFYRGGDATEWSHVHVPCLTSRWICFVAGMFKSLATPCK